MKSSYNSNNNNNTNCNARNVSSFIQRTVGLNLTPILINKQQTNDLSSSNSSSGSRTPPPTGDALSPPITGNLNDLKSFLHSNSATVSLPTTAGKALTFESTGLESCTPSYLLLGDYVIIEAHLQTDAFGSAFNLKKNRFFYWKKFEQRDFVQKLEPYFIMDGASEKVYKFSEILIESNLTTTCTASSSSSSMRSQLGMAKRVFLIFECHHGDCHTYMKEAKKLGEPEAKHLYRQMVEAVQACHENGIIVRDIKLKKFVFVDAARTRLALASLEDCLVLDEAAESDQITSQQGCPAYVSPEVLSPSQASYSGRLSDSWSLGIVLYTLLFGRYPFHHQTITHMFAKITRGRFQIPPASGLGLDARILIRALIRVNASERLSCAEILAHAWFRKTDADLSFEQRLQQQQSLSSNENGDETSSAKSLNSSSASTTTTTTTPKPSSVVYKSQVVKSAAAASEGSDCVVPGWSKK